MNTLSGRFLVLTMVFVMLAEVLIFVPSVARFREAYLENRLERAQIASLAALATDMIDPALEMELLQNAEVYNVVLQRDSVRQLVLSSPIPSPISDTFDLRRVGPWDLIGDALSALVSPGGRVIRVIGAPVREGGEFIEITMDAGPLRTAMVEYGLRILVLSAVISAVTALLLFVAVRRFMVNPIRGVIHAMESYAAAPEDARRIIEPRAGLVELRQAETALAAMQTHLTAALRQKDRLAQLGIAVAKISHDLRNVLTTAQLFADRLEASEDPKIGRMAPKLLASISRAVAICEGTLAFGRAEEPPPALSRVPLGALVEDVFEGERLAASGDDIVFEADVPAAMVVRADPEQLHRILGNLVRNARQALAASGGGRVCVTGREDARAWTVRVADDGPGLPPRAKDHLFEPFHSGTKSGTGLGLTIANDLVRGHGGTLSLLRTGTDGTTFEIRLPKGVVDFAADV